MGRLSERIFGSAVVRITAGFLLAALVLAAAGWFLTGPLRSYPGTFDTAVRGMIRQLQSPMWTSLFLAFTKLGSTLYLTIVGCTAGVVFIVLRWFRPLMLFIVAMAGQAALHHGFKWLFARPRPQAMIAYPVAEGFSFPSGHALSALCLYGTIAWFVTNRLENPALKAGVWIMTVVLVFLIGASRAYIGIHHPSDVIAGFLAAAIWTAAIASADERQF
jgi:undecaprenyl-diphosphatase